MGAFLWVASVNVLTGVICVVAKSWTLFCRQLWPCRSAESTLQTTSWFKLTALTALHEPSRSVSNDCNQNAAFSDNREWGENGVPQMGLLKITAYVKGQMPQPAVCRVILVLDNSGVLHRLQLFRAWVGSECLVGVMTHFQLWFDTNDWFFHENKLFSMACRFQLLLLVL